MGHFSFLYSYLICQKSGLCRERVEEFDEPLRNGRSEEWKGRNTCSVANAYRILEFLDQEAGV